MTVDQIGHHYYLLAQQNKWEEIIDTYYDDEVESIEPSNSKSQPYTKGKPNVKAKAVHFTSMIEEFYSGYTTQPVFAGNLFSVGMGMDIKMKGAGRMNFDEICIFTVRNGKIIREEFIMNWSDGDGHDYHADEGQ